MHRHLGVTDIESVMRGFVRPYMPQQHRDFYAQIPFVVLAARDASGRPWATLLTAASPSGFIHSSNSKTLDIKTVPHQGDPLHGALQPGADVGLLGIELHTRRRNRVNGRVSINAAASHGKGSSSITVSVDQSFGNCPQYIVEREWEWNARTAAQPATHGNALSSEQHRWVQQADTLFVASGHRGSGDKVAYGMDASHRGGEPGFVHVNTNQAGRLLSFPVRTSHGL